MKRFFYLICCVGLVVSCILLVVQNANSQNRVVKKVPTDANQGVAVDKNYYYAISNTRITKHNKTTAETITTWEADTNNKAFEHFKHMNSGTVVGGKLYIAHSRYSIDPNYNTIEIFNVKNDSLEHEETILMPRDYGSLTWIDKHPDGSWWMCYAVYGEGVNEKTKLVKYSYRNNKFIEIESWFFPKAVIKNWGDMSCSGGSWGADGFLYTSGHDQAKSFVLGIDKSNELNYLHTENNVGFDGQAIAWDRSSDKPMLWGIIKRKFITITLLLKE